METEAAQALGEAERLAVANADARVRSYAIGYLGNLAEKKQHWDEALPLTVKALFAAQQAGLPEASFEWEWQMARIFDAQGQYEQALVAYRRALQTFHSLRSDMSLASVMRGDGRPFRDATGRIFFELAGLILRRPGGFAGPPGRSAQYRGESQDRGAGGLLLRG